MCHYPACHLAGDWRYQEQPRQALKLQCRESGIVDCGELLRNLGEHLLARRQVGRQSTHELSHCEDMSEKDPFERMRPPSVAEDR